MNGNINACGNRNNSAVYDSTKLPPPQVTIPGIVVTIRQSRLKKRRSACPSSQRSIVYGSPPKHPDSPISSSSVCSAFSVESTQAFISKLFIEECTNKKFPAEKLARIKRKKEKDDESSIISHDDDEQRDKVDVESSSNMGECERQKTQQKKESVFECLFPFLRGRFIKGEKEKVHIMVVCDDEQSESNDDLSCLTSELPCVFNNEGETCYVKKRGGSIFECVFPFSLAGIIKRENKKENENNTVVHGDEQRDRVDCNLSFSSDDSLDPDDNELWGLLLQIQKSDSWCERR